MKLLKVLGLAALPVAALSLSSCGSTDEFRTVITNDTAWNATFDTTDLTSDISDFIEAQKALNTGYLVWNTSTVALTNTTATAIQTRLNTNFNLGIPSGNAADTNIFRNNTRVVADPMPTGDALVAARRQAFEDLDLQAITVSIVESDERRVNYDVVVSLRDVVDEVANVTLAEGLQSRMGLTTAQFGDLDVNAALEDAIALRTITFTANDATQPQVNALNAIILDYLNENRRTTGADQPAAMVWAATPPAAGQLTGALVIANVTVASGVVTGITTEIGVHVVPAS